MKKIILLLLVPFLMFGQIKKVSDHSTANLKCSTCHACDIPTKENPCLIVCPRESMVTIDKKPSDGPKILTIDRFKKHSDIYEPVKFSHFAHAEMSDMGGGCKMCHHYNPPGNVIGCIDCHELDRKRLDVSKPDLKGAYHRQCIECHRAWSGETDCVYCHQVKGKQTSLTGEKKLAAESVHPKIVVPEKINYNTNTNKGKLVTFRHKEHIDLFGFKCEDCHTNENCIKCHAEKKTKSAVSKKPLIEKHSICSDCHNTNSSCNNCHSNKETSGFDHKLSTGFDISKFHSKLSCIRCHTVKGKYTGLVSECVSCHGVWNMDNFKHRITGLELDEVHLTLECGFCHKEITYQKPICTDCHEDKVFPKEKPGKLVKK